MKANLGLQLAGWTVGFACPPGPTALWFIAAPGHSGSQGQGRRSADRRSPGSGGREQAPKKQLKEWRFLPVWPGSGRKAEPFSSKGVSPASPRVTEGEGRRPAESLDLQAGPDLQKNRARSFSRSTIHRPIAPGAEDPLHSLSLSFLIREILMPTVQGEGRGIH